MESRIKHIYQELYIAPRTKEYFANQFNVTTKTIENTINQFKDDIVYDRKISSYRFNNILPKYISHEIFFKLFQHSIGNTVIKNDFIDLGKIMSKAAFSVSMIDTSTLSELAQKIILCDVAINHNCILEIAYSGNAKPKEIKYIKPHTIISTGLTYYLYGSYDVKNKKDVGQTRSFGFNGMGKINAHEYTKDSNFRIDRDGNAYGLYEKNRYVTLELMPYCASFFRKEGLLNQENFNFIIENADGSIIIDMYYNHEQEIISLIQQWMPQISIRKDIELKNKIYAKIQSNVGLLVQT